MPEARCGAPRQPARYGLAAACIALLVLGFAPLVAPAAPRSGDTATARVYQPRLAQTQSISREAAAAAARKATGGKILSVRRRGRVYVVRVLLDGERVRTVQVDAQSGEVRG